MSDVKLKIVQPRVVVKFPVSIPGPAGVPDLSALPEYPDDETAIADGLNSGDAYWVSQGSDAYQPGTLRRVL